MHAFLNICCLQLNVKPKAECGLVEIGIGIKSKGTNNLWILEGMWFYLIHMIC